MPTPIRVTIWNEFVHERQNPTVAAIYPKGIHGLLAEVWGQKTTSSSERRRLMR